ncbi:lymphocyte antigen 6 complex locus protein G6f [Elgaria multicarinata webbii]|uniref:lymphocyte antigen 6 complex locus protein G6f n=1 Tax=Elgaria multicarinata webbii TaxID=159646 RepID=UPI002FCD15BE
MGGVPQSFMAAVGALATVFLCLRLCGAEIVYAEKGSSHELPCPCPSCSGEPRTVSWHSVHRGKTIDLFSKLKNNRINRLSAGWDHLSMLPNYSLHFNNVTDNDTGRYWCDVNNYYDLVVVTGIKRMLESRRAGTVCYVLSCSVSVKELNQNVASWWEGKDQLQKENERAGYTTFIGHRASQLHICLQKEASEREARERTMKCRFGQMEITFNLTGKEQEFCIGGSLLPFPHGTVEDCPSSQCPESGRNSGPWVPMAVCIILQFLIIFALVAALLRKRHRQKHEHCVKQLSKDVSKSEYTPQLYENVKT